MVERKKESSRGLVVKGVGYVAPGEKPTTQTTQKRLRGPFVMPSAPFKSASASTRIAMTPVTQQRSPTTRFGSMSNLSVQQKEELCHCQHPADIEFLQDVYLENMRIRVQMLELENKCLKGGATEEEVAASSSFQASRSLPTNKKRVEFADRRLFGSTEAGSTEKQPKTLVQQVSSDQELFDKLEEAYQKEFRQQEKIKALTMENRKMAAAREDLEKQLNRLNSGERSISHEKRVLMEDNVELQRRLDDLTPLLAAKDAEIERLEMEKSTLIGKIRRLSTGTATKPERESSSSNFGRTQELAFKDETIDKLEQQLRQYRQQEAEFNEELTTLKRRLKEEQALIKREQSMRENYAQDNDKLIKENSELVSKLNRAENLVDRHERERHAEAENRVSKAQLAELRDNEQRLQTEILGLEKRLKNETESRRSLEEQEGQTQNSRRKIQEELQALQALSDSLSAENQGLRQEKLSITQRMELLFEKLEDKEREIKRLTQMLEEFQQKFVQGVERLQAEMQRQSDNGDELDQIVRHARQLSTSNGSSMRMSVIKEVSIEKSQTKSPKSTSRRRIDDDNTKSESSRQSSIAEELSEKDARPVLSPITSPVKASAPIPPIRMTPNRSIRTMSQTEKSLTRAYSEDTQSTSSSLAQKYRRKMS